MSRLLDIVGQLDWRREVPQPKTLPVTRRTVEVPEGVRRKALAQGADGRRWLDTLGDVVAELERDWQLSVGAAFTGGSGGYVAEAVTAEGMDAVLKVAIPDGLLGHGTFMNDLQTLVIAEGRGYVRLVRHDEARRAMLQERLGRPLSDLGFPVRRQIEIIADTLQRGWVAVPDDAPLPTGADKARWLAEFIEMTWRKLDQPCAAETVQRALSFASAREEAFDLADAVLVHGDAHPANVLEDPTSGGERFKLIDPDGMLADRAYDVAIPMRGWNAELLAGDAVRLAHDWCSHFSDLTGVEGRAIWEWAFVERVSTGLFVTTLDGRGSVGREFLEVAELLTDVDP